MLKHGLYHLGNVFIAIAMAVAIYGNYTNQTWTIYNFPLIVIVGAIWIVYVIILPPVLMHFKK